MNLISNVCIFLHKRTIEYEILTNFTTLTYFVAGYLSGLLGPPGPPPGGRHPGPPNMPGGPPQRHPGIPGYPLGKDEGQE